MSGAPEITVVNYPAEGQTTAIRTVMFGGPAPVTLLMEVDEDDGELVITLTIGNGPANPDLPEFLSDLRNLLSAVVDSDVAERVAEAMDARRAEAGE